VLLRHRPPPPPPPALPKNTTHTHPPGFLDRIRIELRLQGQLQAALGQGPGFVQQLLQQRAASTGELGELRLDLAPMKQVRGCCWCGSRRDVCGIRWTPGLSHGDATAHTLARLRAAHGCPLPCPVSHTHTHTSSCG
jgi:hypothetical protein